jgi:hypothetical protein
MEKKFDTIYGEVTVRNAMLECNDSTTLSDGIEIKGNEIGLIEIYRHYDLDELSIEEVESIIDTVL